MTEWRSTACVLCSQTCGIRVRVADGHITEVRGDPDDPVTAGYLCGKALQVDFYQHPPHRLTTPLRRAADGTFEPISWDDAEREIAARLVALREAHGGDAFALYGGGGQGNHLGGAHALALLGAMGSDRWFNASAQENTGEWWVNGRLFGAESCHPTEDVPNADTVVLVGTNPWQSHTFPRARTELNRIAGDPSRHLVVIDPRRTETAERADVHLQPRPGSDAFVLAALLQRVIDGGGMDEAFLAARTTDTAGILEALAQVSVDRFAAAADVDPALIEQAARLVVDAERVAVRDYMGVRHNRHSALGTYLCRLLSILTGNVGVPGGINLHSWLYPRIRDASGGEPRRSPVTGQVQIGGLYPPNRLPEEILTDHPQRIRALVVDSANPAHTSAGSPAQRAALDALDLLVVIDVTMTETARLADYVLPAATQFEKWEMTLFTHGFPDNAIHLRPPVLPPTGQARPEHRIYGGILRAMGALPDDETLDRLRAVAATDRVAFLGALFEEAGRRPELLAVGAAVLAATLGATLPEGAAGAATLWFACHDLVGRDPDAVRAAGVEGEGPELAEALFDRILTSPSGCVFSRHSYDGMWRHVRHADGRIHVTIPELVDELLSLDPAELAAPAGFPLVLAAGQRRAWNANAIVRDDRWRRRDEHGALLVHPDDLAAVAVGPGERVRVVSAVGSVVAVAEADDRQRRGCCVLPHGYGFVGCAGPAINELTDPADRCAIAGTPHHKHVPVRLERVDVGCAGDASARDCP